MKAIFFLAGVPALCLALLPIGALAQTAVFAAETGVSTISPCPSFCGGAGGAFDSDIDGGTGLLTSFSSLNNVDGDGRAETTLSGQVELPVLRADSFSHAQVVGGQRSSLVSSQAFGLQGFYVGATSYALDIELSGTASDVPDVGTAMAHVMILRDDDPGSDISFTSHYPTMKFELIPGSDLTLLADAVDGVGQAILTIPPDNAFHSVMTTLSVTGLTPGQLIYVWADLSTSGIRGGFGDAYSTLTMAFQDTTGLSHVAAIPEPSEYALLLAGLAVIGAAKRRASRSPRGPRRSARA